MSFSAAGMRRKIIKLGTSTLVVSLPSAWAREQHLKAGAEISLEESGTGLLLSAGAKSAAISTEICLTHMSESSIRTLITNTYRAGYDRITVTFEKPEQLSTLRDVIRTRLIGFEIVENAEKHCLVENITEPSGDQFDKIFRKELFAIEEFVALTEKRLAKSEKHLDYQSLEETIQKYDNFCRRIIVKEAIGSPRAQFLWTFLGLLLHAQRELYHLHRFLDKKEVIHESHAKQLKHVRSVFDLLQRAYLEKNPQLVGEIHDLQERALYHDGYADLMKGKGDANVVTFHLLSSLRNFYLASSPLIGLLAEPLRS